MLFNECLLPPAMPPPAPGVRRPLSGRLPPHNDHLRPITVPHHVLVTSPARSHANSGKGKELPLHLIHLILSHLDDAGDLARATRTSRLFYYMTLPRLYENVTLRSYSEIRYVDGRPEGYGGGSPFAFALNTLVTRNVTDYIQSFRVVGEWREHDLDDYSKGRVPDNSMMLQVAMRACLDRMKNLTSFAWELNMKPLQTVYQSLVAKPNLTSLTLRFQTKRIPGPATTIGPLPNLVTLVVYDIDPLCNPDDISGLFLTSTKLENLKMHFNPRMRDTGEESVNLMTFFGRCVAAKHAVPFKRMALYNMYARNPGHEFEAMSDPSKMEELTFINSMGSSNPMTVFLDDTWRINSKHPIPHNLKMIRQDLTDKEHVVMLRQFHGLERMYLINNPRSKGSKTCSTVATPSTPTSGTPTISNGASTSTNGTPVTEQQCRGLASEYIAVIQSNHRGMRHLLLPAHWQLSDNALFKLCQSLPQLEQLGFAFCVPPLESLRQVLSLVPKIFALRFLYPAGSEFAEKFLEESDIEMHRFAMSTEFWRPEYKNIRYLGMGANLVFKLGGVIYPSKPKPIPEGQENSFNAKMNGPRRVIQRLSREDVKHIEIWGMDTTEFDPKFP